MGKLFLLMLGLSPIAGGLFFYNIMQTDKLDKTISVEKSERNLQQERFDLQFSSSRLEFAETKEEKEMLEKEILRSQDSISKAELKKKKSEERYAKAEAASDAEFLDMQNTMNDFEEEHGDEIDEKEFDF